MGLNIASLITEGIGASVAKVISTLKEDPTKKGEFQAAVDAQEAAFKLKALELEKEIEKATAEQANSIALAQIAVNQEEAKSDKFKSNWRPLIGYICGAGLAYQILLRPLINFGAQCFGAKAVAEQLDMGTLLTLLMGMLGLGAYRTVEKLQDKDKD